MRERSSFLFLLPVIYVWSLLISITIQTIVLGVFGVLFLINIKENVDFLKNRVVLTLTLFFCIATLLSLFSSHPFYTIKKAAGLFFETFLALLLGMHSKKYAKLVKKHAVYAFVILGGASLIFYIIAPMGFSPLINRHGVLTGFLGGKLTYPGVIVPFAGVLLEGLLQKITMIELMGGIIFLLSLALNGTRSYILGTFLSGMVTVVACAKRHEKVVAVGLIGTVLAFIFSISKVHAFHLDPEKIDHSGRVRLHLWKMGLSVFKKHPVIGIGFEAWPLLADSIVDNSGDSFLKDILPKNNIDARAIRGHLHNTYLMMLINGGVILFVSFIYLIFTMLKEAFLLEDRMKYALLFMLITFFIAGFFEYNFSDTEVIHSVFFFTGLYLGGKRS